MHNIYYLGLSGERSLPFGLLVFQNKLFEKILSGIQSESQRVWSLIRPEDLSGLIWVQTVCQSYQQTTLIDKELRKKGLLSRTATV